MGFAGLFFLIIGLGLVGWFAGRARASALATDEKHSLNSLPGYHGWFVTIWAIAPALLFLAVWSSVTPTLVTNDVLSQPAAADLPTDPMMLGGILSEARAIAQGTQDTAFQPQADAIVPLYTAAISKFQWIGIALSLLLVFAGAAYAYTRLSAQFRARARVERGVMFALLGASLIAILTTIGIVGSLLIETVRFFEMVSPLEFLFGTEWNPVKNVGEGLDNGYGAIPLFWGTVFIGAIIAMIVAIPLGLMSAVYLTQYATPTFRQWMKPTLEILAGIPTVVYGYFAALTVAPCHPRFCRDGRFGEPHKRKRAGRWRGDGGDDYPIHLLNGR